MEESGHSFDKFSIEMGDFELKKVKSFDRLWRIEEGGSIDQWPLVYNGKIYFGSFNHNVYCLNAYTGEFIWKFKARDRIGISSPVEWNGVIYIGSYDYHMYALDAKSGEMLWKFPTRGEVLSTPAIRNGIIYFGSKDKNIYAVDARTGKLVWKYKTQGEIISDATIYENKVIFGSYDRNYYCFEAETGRIVWKFTTEEECVSSGPFAIHEGYIYLGSFDSVLRKIDVNTGTEAWKKKFGQYGLGCSTLIHKGILIYPEREGILFALDLDGNVLWKFKTANRPIGRPVVSDDKVYFTSEDKNFYCISLEGKLLWKYKTHAMNWWMPAFLENMVYFTSYDCFIRALDKLTGQLIWKFRTQGSPSPILPPYEAFELQLKIPESVVEEESKKTYEIDFVGEEEETFDTYKSRITYQTSTTYREKGKYQVDSDEEAF